MTSELQQRPVLWGTIVVVALCLATLLFGGTPSGAAQAGSERSIDTSVAAFEASHDASDAPYESWNLACMRHMGLKVDVVRSGTTVSFAYPAGAEAPEACIALWQRESAAAELGLQDERAKYASFAAVSKCLEAQGRHVDIPTFAEFVAGEGSWHPYEATPVGHTVIVIGDLQDVALTAEARLQLELQSKCPA